MKRMFYFEGKWRPFIYAGSLGILLVSLLISVLSGQYRTNPRLIVPVGPHAGLADEIIGIGALLSLLPLAVTGYFNLKYLNSVERNIPVFLNDLLQATDSGLSLPDALIQASKRDYGPISFEMGIAMTKFSMGYEFSSSIAEAGKRLRHPFASQVAVIISEAYAAGGRTRQVLQSSVNLFNGLEGYKGEKQSELRPYVHLVYISVAIFLVISIVIISRFILPFESAAALGSQVASGSTNVSLNGVTSRFNLSQIPSASYFDSIFFLSALLESVFGGIVAGKIVDGSAFAGLRHSIILVAITIAVFAFPHIGVFSQ
jgi:flagellar protein FlaJ